MAIENPVKVGDDFVVSQDGGETVDVMTVTTVFREGRFMADGMLWDLGTDGLFHPVMKTFAHISAWPAGMEDA